MYKKINRLNFESFGFISEIDSIFNKYSRLFFNELEYTLIIRFMESNHSNFRGEETRLLRKYKSKLESDNELQSIPCDFVEGNIIEILDGLLSNKMEEELITSSGLRELSNTKKKSQNQREMISFKEYLQTDYKNKTSINEFVDSFKKYSEKISSKDKLYERPIYFLLYRVRNTIVKTMNEREYTIKYMNTYLKELSKEFMNVLFCKIIETNFFNLTRRDKLKIYKEIEECMFGDFLMMVRLGKNMEEGDELVEKIKREIEENFLRERLVEKSFNSFLRVMNDFDEEGVIKWFDEEYVSLLKRETEYICDEFDVSCEINTRFVKQNLKKILVGSILEGSSDKENTIKEGFYNITLENKGNIIHKHNEKYLKNSTFSVALNVQGIEIEAKFLDIHIGNINLLSNEKFEGWQLEKYGGNKRDIIFNADESQKSSSWAIVNEIKCGAYDYEKAVLIARRKLNDFLNHLYYFISKENQIDYNIMYSTIVFNEDKRITHWTNLGKLDIVESKKIDDIDLDLLDFLIAFEESSNSVKQNLTKAINLFIEFCKSTNPEKKAYFLGQLLREIFKEESEENVALFSSIIVAGINYDKNDVTYKEMRLWLFEDFKELLEISISKGNIPLKERVLDRFKVFSRNIIGTLLFNLFPENKSICEKITKNDLIGWILYINPEDKLIESGGEK